MSEKHELVEDSSDPQKVRCSCGWPGAYSLTSRRAWKMHVRPFRLKGRQAITKCELRNGLARVPAGTRCTVGTLWRGTTKIETQPCTTCGVSVYISQVPIHDLDLLDAEE
jgi:hypothetical protein